MPLEITLDTKITPELKREGMMREVIRTVQSARKEAGLNVDDRIKLSLDTSDKALTIAIHEYRDMIASETLAKEVVTDKAYAHTAERKVEGAELKLSLEKA